jgi:fatty acid desaturase
MNMNIAAPDLLNKKSRVLSPAEIEEFGRRVDEIRAEVHAQLGKADADYIYKVRDFVRYTEIASRTMLMFGGWIPPVWLLASVMLGVSKIVENMELGHNVMHGQYDWLNDPSLNGATYDWDTVCAGEDWKYTHNFMHHTYTNIIGKDHDIGYGLLRMTEAQPWHPRFLLNIPNATFLMLTFQWSLALQRMHLEDVVEGRATLKESLAKGKNFAKKALRQGGKDYVLFPVIAGPMFLPVLAGNITANLIRNIWAFSIIFCGHFTSDVEMFEDKSGKETKAEWYLRQLKGSGNLTGGKIFHFMTGNLSHQIEHHMFPDTPANRYQEMAPKLRALCDEYGQHYNTGSFSKQFSEVMLRIAVHSLPNSVIGRARGVKAKLRALWDKSGA